MALYLYGTTALEFWFNERKNAYHPHRTLMETLGSTFESSYERTRVRTLRNTSVGDGQLERLLAKARCRLSAPIHLLAPDASLRRDTAAKAFHVWSGPMPRGTFCHVGDDVFVSSPAFCFLQLAAGLEVVDLIQVGNEMCGAYAPSPYEATGLLRCPPLTSVEEVASFCKRVTRVNGSKNALRAARYLAQGLASPMETALQMLLCLPPLLGGYGLCGARVNYPVDMRLAVQARLDGDHCLCDLFWPEHRLAVEYDGELAHLDGDRDRERANRLSSIGITLVSVSKKQLFSREKTDVLAKQVAKHLGRRIHWGRLGREWTQRNALLRKAVLPPSAQGIERVLGVA